MEEVAERHPMWQHGCQVIEHEKAYGIVSHIELRKCEKRIDQGKVLLWDLTPLFG